MIAAMARESKDDERKARLAAALRANLRRRKAEARAAAADTEQPERGRAD